MERLCSGYDEYEGIFGPLGVYGTAGRQFRSAGGPSNFVFNAGGRRSSRSRHHHRADAPSRLASFGQMRSDVDARSKYLAGRRAKRRLRPLNIDVDAEDESVGDSEHEGQNPLAQQHGQSAASAPLSHTQRQVWLPTRNFSFRQRAGKLDMRAIARLDLEKIVATTDIDVIQRHLENLAFADVTIDDVQHYSDTYFLKLFQIAQLTLEYLLNVQDSLVTHSESVETQCEQLLSECQQLETENDAFEAEIASLKKETRQKQRTIATFEVMLLNASASQRHRVFPNSAVDKENAAAEANAIVDRLLGSTSGAEEKEQGVVDKPVDCIVCGKKFLSAEYLIRHQQRKHQSDSKKTNKKHQRKKSKRSSSSQSLSSSASSGTENSTSKKRSKGVKTAPLPTEVVKALEEKNELARQLVALQEQLVKEKNVRDEQSKLLEGKQSQLTSQMVGSMGKLQEMLLEIEKRQEATKQDMIQYTQETITRLQNETANAHLLKKSESRAGKMLSDDEEDEEQQAAAEKRLKEQESGTVANWQEKQLEKMLEVFFKAQAQQQQEIDALAQENSKLWSKKKSKQKSRRHQPHFGEASSLMQMAVLDAQRFGIDYGDLGREGETQAPLARPVAKVALQEDKLVQTDEEDDSTKNKIAAAVSTQEVQTDSVAEDKSTTKMPAPLPEKKPIRRNTVDERAISSSQVPEPKSKPVLITEAKAVIPDPPLTLPQPQESKSGDSKEKKLQHAAQMVGKIAIGFLTRKKLKNPANWLICLPFSALGVALSEEELRQLRERNTSSSKELVVEVENGMTANELRLAVAQSLSGRSQFSEDDDANLKEGNLVIDYHRVLLHHKDTREELHGDRLIHSFKNQIEVEIVPFYQAAEDHIEGVYEFHSDVTDRLREIRRASMELAEISSVSEQADHEKSRLRKIVRLQARVRGFLAKRQVEMVKIDQLVEKRIVKMRTAAASKRQQRASSSVGQSISVFSDPLVAKQCKQVHESLAAAVKSKLLSSSGEANKKDLKTRTTTVLSTAAYEQQLLVLEKSRNKLPSSVQSRIKSLHERLEQLVATEYDPEKAKLQETQNDAAIKIQSTVQVAIARRRLQMLLGKRRDQQEALNDQEELPVHSSPLLSPLSALSSGDEPDSKSAREEEGEPDDFDAKEIAKLADAYEDGLAVAASVEEQKQDDHNRSSVEEEDTQASTQQALPTRNDSPPLEELDLPEDKPAVVRRTTTRTPQLTPAARSAQQQPPRASTPIRYMETTMAAAATVVEPGRSPRPKLDKEIISPFSKTPLLSRRSGPATRRGTGYDNAR